MDEFKLSRYALSVHATNTLMGESPLVMKHPIRTIEGRVELGAGRAFGEDDVKDLKALLASKKRPSLAFLPEYIIGSTEDELAFFIPGGKNTFWFRTGKEDKKVEAPFPSLVVRVKDNRFKVACVRGNERPGPEDKVYRVPLGNIDLGGEFCCGANKIGAVKPSDIQKVKSFIFDAPYTEFRGFELVEGVKSWKDLLIFWDEQQGQEKFDESRLIPMNYDSLSEWLEG